MREVLASRATGDPEAATAVQVYLHRLRREIAAAASSLECLDALVLTGGVAEGSAWLRAELATSLGLLSIQLDRQRNNKAAHDALLSQPGAPVAVLLVHAREDVELARGAAAVVRGQHRN
jgi:acetate kinase